MLRVVFFGAPSFGAKTLLALIEAKVNIVGVVTKPDKPAGRGASLKSPAVKEVALEKLPNVPLFQPEKASSSEFVEILKGLNADLFVVVAYGEILRQSVLDLPKKGCLNVHASLLPAYRGAAPIQRAIESGEKMTGITIQHMALKMDAGDVIKRVLVPIEEEMRAEELEKALNIAGNEALLEVLELFERGEVRQEAQDETKVTFAKKVTPEEAQIDVNKTAKELSYQIRAFYPNPGSWVMVDLKGEKKRLKVLRARVYEGEGPECGKLEGQNKRVLLGCREGALELLEVKLEGKKAMKGEEFLRGNL
jgi:methionyl-tRNA formyltransferase